MIIERWLLAAAPLINRAIFLLRPHYAVIPLLSKLATVQPANVYVTCIVYRLEAVRIAELSQIYEKNEFNCVKSLRLLKKLFCFSSTFPPEVLGHPCLIKKIMGA